MSDSGTDARIVIRVPVVSLRAADSPRSGGIDGEHARELARSGAAFPPILVHSTTMRVIDGMHRLHAARLRGQTDIDVVYFHGDDADAFVRAVRDNLAHGRPLTHAERVAAAARIVSEHPDWSDRRVAAVTGISASTAGAVRRRRGQRAALRVGRDGRVRPMNTASARMLAGELIRRHPDIPLRAVADRAGISPATAQDVRRRLRRGEDPVPERLRARSGQPSPDPGTPGVPPARGPAAPGTAGPVSPGAAGPVSPGTAGPVPPDATGPRSPGAAGPGSPGATGPRSPGAAGPGSTGAARQGSRAAATTTGRGPGTAGAAPATIGTAVPDATGTGPGTGRVAPAATGAAPGPSPVRRLARDPALRSSELGRVLIRLLAANALDQPHWEQLLGAVPPHCRQSVAGLADRTADRWREAARWLRRRDEPA